MCLTKKPSGSEAKLTTSTTIPTYPPPPGGVTWGCHVRGCLSRGCLLAPWLRPSGWQGRLARQTARRNLEAKLKAKLAGVTQAKL
jgi:hypothetical protein